MNLKFSNKNKKLSSFGIKNPLEKILAVHNPKRGYEYCGDKTMKKIQAHEAISVPDGVHKGLIKELTYKDKPFEYIDVGIELKGEEPEGMVLKASYPYVISDKSALGRLLERLGKKVDFRGKEGIDPEEHIKLGIEVDFQTTTVKKVNGEFCNIILDSVKPSKK